MEAFFTYLFKSVLWITGFALVYFFFLQNERYFVLKRIYLLTGLIVSTLFPLITIHYKADITAPAESLLAPSVAAGSADGLLPVKDQYLWVFMVLMGIYLSGVIYFLVCLIKQTIPLLRVLREKKYGGDEQTKVIYSSAFPATFTFFNHIFLKSSESDEEMREIMNHEMIHVQQKHWVDLLIVEILRVIQWMNPFIWMYRRFIKINHEYLADKGALRLSGNPANYKAALLNQIMGGPVLSLVHTFNYSINKKRFEMMKDIIFLPYRQMKVLLVLPVIAVILYAFAEPEYNYIYAPGDSETVETISSVILTDIRGKVSDAENKPLSGVNILVTGSYQSVQTDNSGVFILENVPGGSLLVFSLKGYKTQTVKTDSMDELEVVMQKDPDYREAVPMMSSSRVQQPDINRATTKKDGDMEPFVVVEEMPMYKGGDMGLLTFIAENIRYPEEAKADSISGRVIIRFTVTEKGNVDNVEVISGVHPLLDAEAVRVISMLGDFEPGRQGGKAVPVWYSVPVSFTLR